MKWKLAVLLGLSALAVSAWLSNFHLFRQVVQGHSDLTRNISAHLGPWHLVEEVPASPAEIRGLETTDIIKRTYSDGTYFIELVVAYIAHSTRKSAHAQEACLRGGGALVGTIESRRLEPLPVLSTVISIDHHNRKSWVYYWYKIGKSYTSKYLESSFKMFLGGFAGEGNQGASLIRLLTSEHRGESPGNIHKRLEQFTAYLLPELERNLP